MTIIDKEEDVETRMLREAREKRRKAGYLDTWIERPLPSKPRIENPLK